MSRFVVDMSGACVVSRWGSRREYVVKEASIYCLCKVCREG